MFSKEFEQNKSESEEAPLLFVDVNLGPNDQRRIVVYEGDDARQLAQNFCQENDLDEETLDKLEMLLLQQIAAVLTKISEDEESPNNKYADASLQSGEDQMQEDVMLEETEVRD